MGRRWLILSLLYFCPKKSIAFFVGRKRYAPMRAMQLCERVLSGADTTQLLPGHFALAFMMSFAPVAHASAAPFDEYPLLPSPMAAEAPSSKYTLSDTEAFKMLPRQPVYSGAVKELMELRDLQDSRLRACEDKEKFWEQCFMYGQRDGEDRGRMDNQLIPPLGSLDPPTPKIPTW